MQNKWALLSVAVISFIAGVLLMDYCTRHDYDAVLKPTPTPEIISTQTPAGLDMVDWLPSPTLMPALTVESTVVPLATAKPIPSKYASIMAIGIDALDINGDEWEDLERGNRENIVVSMHDITEGLPHLNQAKLSYYTEHMVPYFDDNQKLLRRCYRAVTTLRIYDEWYEYTMKNLKGSYSHYVPLTATLDLDAVGYHIKDEYRDNVPLIFNMSGASIACGSYGSLYYQFLGIAVVDADGNVLDSILVDGNTTNDEHSEWRTELRIVD